MNNEEKPWVLHFGSRGETLQVDENEYEELRAAIEAEKSHLILKDGSVINLRIASIVKNLHYISPESIKRTRLKRELENEFLHLKNEGVLKTKKEYIEWKKKKLKNEKE